MRSIDGIDWVEDWPDRGGNYFVWDTTLSFPSIARVYEASNGGLVVVANGAFLFQREAAGRYLFSAVPVDIVGPP